MTTRDTPEQLSAAEAEAVLEYLATAPPAAQGWALRQQAALQATLDQTADSQATLGQVELDAAAGVIQDGASEGEDFVFAGEVAGDVDESDDFYDGLEEDDDVLTRPRKKSQAKNRQPQATGQPDTAGAGAAKGAANRGPDKKSRKISASARWAIVAAVIIGIVAGIWWAGRPGPVADMGALPEGHPDLSQMGENPHARVDVGQAAEKIVALETALADNPDNVDDLLELGVVHFDLGDTEAAGTQWKRVLELEPENVTALYNMAFLYLSQEPPDAAAAEKAWQTVIEADPKSELAQAAAENLAHLEETGISDSDDTSPASGDSDK